MAVLSTFVMSDDSNQVPNPNGQGSMLQVVNPQNIFRPMFVPGGHSFSVTFGFLEIDPKQKHNINFFIVSSSGETIVNIENIEVPPNAPRDTSIPEEATGLMLNFDLRNVPFRIEGKYEARIIFDGQLLDSKPFYVFKQESK